MNAWMFVNQFSLTTHTDAKINISWIMNDLLFDKVLALLSG